MLSGRGTGTVTGFQCSTSCPKRWFRPSSALTEIWLSPRNRKTTSHRTTVQHRMELPNAWCPCNDEPGPRRLPASGFTLMTVMYVSDSHDCMPCRTTFLSSLGAEVLVAYQSEVAGLGSMHVCAQVGSGSTVDCQFGDNRMDYNFRRCFRRENGLNDRNYIVMHW